MRGFRYSGLQEALKQKEAAAKAQQARRCFLTPHWPPSALLRLYLKEPGLRVRIGMFALILTVLERLFHGGGLL